MPMYSSNDPKRLAAYKKKMAKAAERKRVDDHAKKFRGQKQKTPVTPPKRGKRGPLVELAESMNMDKYRKKN